MNFGQRASSLSIKVKHPQFYMHFLILKHVLSKNISVCQAQAASLQSLLRNILRAPGNGEGQLPQSQRVAVQRIGRKCTPASVLTEAGELGKCSGLSSPLGGISISAEPGVRAALQGHFKRRIRGPLQLS